MDSGNILPAYTGTFVMFMKYYFIMAIICGIIYVLYKYVYQRYVKKAGLDSVISGPNNNPAPTDEKIFYLYWTGGFDSTFRLCEMLINEKKVVQPIYVSLTLDNNCESEETCTKTWVRRNRKQEKQAMQAIRKQIHAKYPGASKRLLPTLYIDKDIDDHAFNQAFEVKFYKNNLWPGKRKKHQYLFLSKYAYYHKLYIDIGVLGIHHKKKLTAFLKQNLASITQGPTSATNYQVSVPGHYLEYIRFPLFGRSKANLLAKARKYGYEPILKVTWSCWFPSPATGKACGKCPMCKERII
jgi:hypothetical protein